MIGAVVVLVLAAAAVAVLAASRGDEAAGEAGRRVVRGTAAADQLVLEELGADAVGIEAFGGAGDDFVTAFPSSYDGGGPTPVALLSGGRGADSVTGYAVALEGGPGNDRIRTYELREPLVSTVGCGAGLDTLVMDRQLDGPLDEFGPDCELVRVRTVSNAPGGGNDIIRSRGGDDRVQGDWGDDLAYLGAARATTTTPTSRPTPGATSTGSSVGQAGTWSAPTGSTRLRAAARSWSSGTEGRVDRSVEAQRRRASRAVRPPHPATGEQRARF